MKSSAMFINVGRGESVDESSLASSHKKEINCAAIDTTDPEPLVQDSPLWTLANCL